MAHFRSAFAFTAVYSAAMLTGYYHQRPSQAEVSRQTSFSVVAPAAAKSSAWTASAPLPASSFTGPLAVTMIEPVSVADVDVPAQVTPIPGMRISEAPLPPPRPAMGRTASASTQSQS